MSQQARTRCELPPQSFWREPPGWPGASAAWPPEPFPAAAGFDRFRSYAQTQLSGRLLLLRDVSHWYYAALLPGMVLFLQGRSIYSYIWLLPLLLAAELNHREATKLRNESREMAC
jgi:hypothetical protein